MKRLLLTTLATLLIMIGIGIGIVYVMWLLADIWRVILFAVGLLVAAIFAWVWYELGNL